MDHTTTFKSHFAIRLHFLYEWLQKGIKPWEWDHDNYYGSPEKEEMYGRFYPEDIENIRQLDQMVNKLKDRLEKEQKSRERKRRLK